MLALLLQILMKADSKEHDKQLIKKGLILSAALFSNTLLAAPFSYDGSVELEQRLFFEANSNNLNPPSSGSVQRGQNSARLLLEFFKEWNKGNDQLVFEPFARLDGQDSERTHLDVRQLVWTHYSEQSEVSVGIGRVFWGVTESQHLVDIINQTDNVENIDGEDKLGQPLAHYSYFNDYGTFDAFILPYFRERTFEGASGRLNAGLIIDNDNAIYQSAAEDSHVDFALRYSHTLGDWGLGFSWFSGTSREPDLLRFANFETLNTTPFYPQIDQFGSDIQLTLNGWLFKLEAIQRNFDDATYEDFAATTIGAEYSLVGVFGTSYDLGLLAEYSWDERGERATSLFQNDAFVGARLALNDLNDSTFLLGFSNDLDNTDSRLVFLEGATRLGASLTLNVELRYFASDTPTDPLFLFEDDSFIQIGLEYFFD